MEAQKVKVSHKIDMISLVILYFSVMCCLVRSDFNFAVIFFCYFAWQNRKDRISLNLIATLIGILMIYDAFFGLFEARAWMSRDQQNPVWNRLHGIHMFAVICSIVEFVLKFFLMYYVCKAKRIDQSAVVI